MQGMTQLMSDRMVLLVTAVAALATIMLDKFVLLAILTLAVVALVVSLAGLFWSIFTEYRDNGFVDVKGFLASQEETSEETEEPDSNATTG